MTVDLSGKVFAKDTEPQGKERTEDANLAVICEFPTMRAASEAYESEEYRELSKLRQKATENSTFTIMEGLDEAAKLRKAMGMKDISNYLFFLHSFWMTQNELPRKNLDFPIYVVIVINIFFPNPPKFS